MGIGIGSVVSYKGSGPYVIVDLENREDMGSCGYDRDYYVMELKDIVNVEYIPERAGVEIKVRGSIFPFRNIEDVAPFRIKREVRYKVERKIAKTITIYE